MKFLCADSKAVQNIETTDQNTKGASKSMMQVVIVTKEIRKFIPGGSHNKRDDYEEWIENFIHGWTTRWFS